MRVLLPLWIAALAYAWWGLNTGWIPHDEGTLAQAAERVSMGELPHQDFDEVYTGGLDWVNAASFRVFGTSLRAMRIPLFLLFALWVPAIFFIARRFVAPGFAALLTALAVTWSLPTYPAPMPSWYVLFLATFGALALLLHSEDGRKRWLVLAGACGGLAVLCKITGLHFVAAALLYLAWREPEVSNRSMQPEAGQGIPGRREALLADGGGPRRIYPTVITALLAVLVVLLVKQIWPVGSRWGFGGEIEHFVLPQALFAAVVARRAWKGSRAPDAVRLKTLLSLVAPLGLGFLIPVACFLAPFAARGALPALVEGVLILPGRRLDLATTAGTPPPLWTLAFAAPLVAIAMIPRPRGRRGPRIALWTAGAALACLAVAVPVGTFVESRYGATGTWPGELFSAIHVAMRHLLPIVAVAAAARLAAAGAAQPPSPASSRLAVLLSVAVFVGLVQFPFSVPIYFFYCAPLILPVVLAMLAMRGVSISDRPGLLIVGGFLLTFMLLVPMRIGEPWQLLETKRLATPRAALNMYPGDAAEYDQVLSRLSSHARGGWIWAGPDAPEISFLTGLRNPTRTIFDCFDRDFADPKARAARILAAIDAHGVTVVAINEWAAFSGPLAPDLADGISSRFPESERVGRYRIAWKE